MIIIYYFFIYIVAGILGYAVGKASYAGTCRSKFKELGIKDGPGFGPWSGKGHHGPGHRWREHWIDYIFYSAFCWLMWKVGSEK